MMKCISLVLGLVAAPLCATARPVQDTDRYIPLVRDGGGWTTKIVLVNLSDAPASFEVEFRPPNGILGKWNLPLRGTAAAFTPGLASGTIAPGGAVTVETSGEGEMSSGYALVTRFGDELLGVEATLHDAKSGSTFSLPLSPAREDVLALPFDNSRGGSTRFVWLSETDYSVLDMKVFNESGKLIAEKSFELFAQDSRAQQDFETAVRYPEMSGTRGIAFIRMSYPTVGFYDESTFAAAALQTDGNGRITAVPSLAPGNWRPRRY